MIHEILFTVERLGDMYAMNTPRGLLMARTLRDLERWMMGYPPGWVDGIPKTAQLRCLGNAVCPPQGALGIRTCLGLLGAVTA